MCDVGYLCANFGIPRPLCSRRRPDVRDRQRSDRQTSDRCQTKASLIAPAYWGQGINLAAAVRVVIRTYVVIRGHVRGLGPLK